MEIVSARLAVTAAVASAIPMVDAGVWL